jgi:putative toxin-antitoxin system antitoxin component (TIGR02293 family)
MPTAQNRALRPKVQVVKRHPGARTLGIRAADTLQMVRLVRAGFPFSRLASFERASGLPRQKIGRFAAISQRTLTRRQREGRLRPEESDRLLRASRIFDMAVGLFAGDVAAARHWLQAPQAGLGGEVPLEFASTEVGAREVENLIGRLEYGVFA